MSLEKLQSDTMCRAFTHKCFLVSVPVLQDKWTAHKCDSTLVCCVICPESFLLLFFPPTTISAVLGPLSQLRPFYLAILPLHSTLIQNARSLFTLFWIEKASTFFLYFVFFCFCESDPELNSGEEESQPVIINEVPRPRVCIDKVLWWVSEPLRHTLNTL